MSVSLEVLQNHIAYTTWATRRLLEAAAKLTPDELNRHFGTADGSVLGSLYHVFGADSVWLSRLHGTSPSGFPDKCESSLSSLESGFSDVHLGWKDWVDALSPDAATREIAYTDLKGNPYKQPIWQIVLHVVNHGTHHRGQVSGFLRSMGHTPPSLDLIFYYRQKT